MKRFLRPLLIAAALAALAAPKIGPEVRSKVSAVLSTHDPAGGPLGPAADGEAVLAARQMPGAAPIKVHATIVQPARLAETVISTGTLLPHEGVELQAETNGRITSINFLEGRAVAKGELLVKLNDADLQALRRSAMLELELAERRERRAAELLEQGFVRADEHDAALSAVKVRRAEIALTEAQIAKTEIRAPFDGVAGLRYVSEGAFVTAASRIASLQRTDTLKVEFSVPEKYGGRIALGSFVSFTVAGREQVFTGEVYAQEPRIDTATRTLLIRAVCPNPGGVLLPGTFANVRLTLAETNDALLVPAGALVPDLDASYLFVLVDGKAERRRVATGVRTDSSVQILSGVTPGDVVITSGLLQIRQGTLVEANIPSDSTLTRHLVPPPHAVLQQDAVPPSGGHAPARRGPGAGAAAALHR